MRSLKKKLGKNGGFTIVEMLIVVAIIAILIAISIPMFTAALERTRHAVDDANRRDAISLGNIEYLTMQHVEGWMPAAGLDYGYQVDEEGSTPVSGGADYQGHLIANAVGVAAKCTGSGTNSCTNNGKTLQVHISPDGNVSATWTKLP